MAVKTKNRLSEEAKAAVQQVANLATTVAPAQAKAETTGAQAMVPGATTKPEKLSPQEFLNLTKQEKRIEKAQRSFIEIAFALQTIDKEKLYREHYTTFAKYTENRWEFSKFEHSRWLDAIEVLTVLRDEFSLEDLPGNEGQARQLARVQKAKGNDVLLQLWHDVREADANGTRISGNLIIEMAKKYGFGSPSEDEGEVTTEGTGAAAIRYEGKALTVSVTVGNSAEAQAIAEKFAPHFHGPNPVKGGYSVVIGADNAQVLSVLGEVFDDRKVKDMTIRLISNS